MGVGHPIENPVTAPWSRPLSHSNYTKILQGFHSNDFDVRWRCETDEPDAKGNTVLHIMRSWAGHEQYSVEIEAGDPEKTEGEEWGKLVNVTYGKDKLGYLGYPLTEEEAKEDVLGFCDGLMKCDFKGAAEKK